MDKQNNSGSKDIDQQSSTELNRNARNKEKVDDSDDTDLEDTVEYGSDSKKSSKFDAVGKQVYLRACAMFNQIPVSYYLRESQKETLKMRHHSLGALGVKALCVSLVSNTTIEVLDLDDNGLQCQGCTYIAEMLKENYFISELTLSNNNIKSKGAVTLFDVVRQSDSILSLNLSGNEIGDQAAASIADCLIENSKLIHINLSYNRLSQVAGDKFGKILSTNTRLKSLDLSFNSIRFKGMQLLLQGLRSNTGLLYLNLSSNAINMEASADLAKMLKENKTLEDLNVSNTNIPLAGALLIARSFNFNNSTLLWLDLSRNPFMAPGCMLIVESLLKSANWSLRCLSFGTILVTRQFANIQTVLERERYLLIIHGGIIEDWHKVDTQQPTTSREALCFLTDEECNQIYSKLQNSHRNPIEKTTLKQLNKVMNDLGWQNRNDEILQRLVPVIERGQVEISSLITQPV